MASRHITLQFGLLSVAAKSEVALEKTPSMTNMCVGQPGGQPHEAKPVTAPRTCVSCGPITDQDLLVKGIKQGKGYTLVTQDKVADAKVEYALQYKGKLNLVPHPAADFLAHTAPGDSLHYLTPADAGGADHYQLLVKLVESHPELAFASLYTPVSATDLYMLSVRDGVLVMEKRTRGQAVKPAPSVGGQVNDALFGMLDSTLEQFVAPYDPDAYEDTYAAALAKMVAEGEQVTIADDKAAAATPVAQSDDDLMEKLRALKAVA